MPKPAAKPQKQNPDLKWKSPFRLLDVAALLKRPRILDFELIAIAGIRYDVTANPPRRQLGSDMFGQPGTALLERALINSMDHGEIAFERVEDGRYSFKTREALAWLVMTVPVVNKKLQDEIGQLNLDVHGDEDLAIPAVGAVHGDWKSASKSVGDATVRMLPTIAVKPPKFEANLLRIQPAVTEYLESSDDNTPAIRAEPPIGRTQIAKALKENAGFLSQKAAEACVDRWDVEWVRQGNRKFLPQRIARKQYQEELQRRAAKGGTPQLDGAPPESWFNIQ